MESRENVPQSTESPPDRLALAAAVSAVAGVGLSGIAWGLAVAMGSADSQAAIIVHAINVGFLIAIPLGYLVAPLLAAIASWLALGYCQEIERSKVGRAEAVQGRRAARRLLVTAVSLALPCGLGALGAILGGRRLGVALPGGLAYLLFLVAVVAAVAGHASQRLYRQSAGTFIWRLWGISTTLIVVLVGVALTPIPDYLSFRRERSAYAQRAAAYSGGSDMLPETAVVATLDCPVPVGRNVVWCSSFQLAWNELRDNAIGEPLKVVGAEALAERLNRAGQSIADLEPFSVYAAAGWIKDGIVDTIERDMASRFPSHSVPDLSDYQAGILAYAYLIAHVPFTHPYRQVERTFAFTDSNGVATDVEAFGLWEAYLPQYKKVREQVDILFARRLDPNDRGQEPEEFAIDLCKHSEPYQVVVARVGVKDTLGETLAYVRLQASEFEKTEYYEEGRRFQESDVLRVPEMFWEIEHRFRELIGKGVANVGIPIVEAVQTVRFRLDRYGAMVESESLVEIASRPRRFEFDRPFLVYVQKRGAGEPFFVMWVDNAELLVGR
jgi:hypothetical protein